MPALSRRPLDTPDECWHVYYGDVRVGTIAIRTGMPPGEDPLSWACGFYPGCHPRECTDGTAETFNQARKDFEAVASVPVGPSPIFKRGATNKIGRPRNIVASIGMSGMPPDRRGRTQA
jgi:hypothetical protein